MSVLLHNQTAVFALGGLGEVGKNMYCIESENDLLIIDSGVMFPEDDLPGIDYVIPSYAYLQTNQYKIRALVITHGHEDHIGGIPFLLQKVNVPMIFAPRLAAALIRNKLEENRVRQKVKIVEIDGNSSLTIGAFKVDFFSTTHSIPDSVGISILSPGGRIVTTGDFKLDLTPVGQHIDFHKIARIGEEGVTLLMSDSTNAEQEGISLSEKSVVESIHEVFRNAPGRLIVATFASNIHRIQQIVEAAVKFNRKICIIGRSMEKTVSIGRDYGYIRCPDSFIIQPEDVKTYRSDELLILCTGSQGEPMAALSRIANGSHKHIRILPGDTVVFSSSPIPGNGQSVNKVVNLLIRNGADVLTSSILTNIHASGHANKEELKMMLTLFKPKYFMPIHGEYHMLKIHAQLAETIGIPKENTFVCANGDVLLLENGIVRPLRRVDTDDIYVDGKDTSGLSTAVIKDRKVLSSDGVVVAVIVMDSRNNSLISKPNIISRGFTYFTEQQSFIDEASDILNKDLNELFLKGKVTFGAIKNTIKNSLSSLIYERTNRNPMIMPVILNKRVTNDDGFEYVVKDAKDSTKRRRTIKSKKDDSISK
ncbi:MAG: ribonuclease J [Bacilli bacterium]|nr:ribonuclease J [Bacilli bacterium]